MAEAAQDATITEEAEAEVKEALEENAEVQVVSVQEKKADSEATEMMLHAENVLTVREEKVVSEATVLQKELRVHSKEKKELQDVLKEVLTDQPGVHSKLLKTESQEEANFDM